MKPKDVIAKALVAGYELYLKDTNSVRVVDGTGVGLFQSHPEKKPMPDALKECIKAHKEMLILYMNSKCPKCQSRLLEDGGDQTYYIFCKAHPIEHCTFGTSINTDLVVAIKSRAELKEFAAKVLI